MSEPVCRHWRILDDGRAYVTCPVHPSRVIATFDGERSEAHQCCYCSREGVTSDGRDVEKRPADDDNGDGESVRGQLRWHHGSDQQIGERICDDCQSEVYSFKEGLICSGCGRTED
jgi:hypothetical protein